MLFEEALPGMRKGKKVRVPPWIDGEFLRLNDAGFVVDERGSIWQPLAANIGRDDWEFVEEPATDAELIAEWGENSKNPELLSSVRAAFAQCANQLRERKL